MEKDTYDLIDTTIKIGLGALIAGISAYFLAIRNHNNELRKIFVEEKRSLIKELAFKIEEIESELNKAILHFHRNDLSSSTAAMVPVSQNAYSARAISNLIGSMDLIEDLENICVTTENIYVALASEQYEINELDKLIENIKERKMATYPHIRTAYNKCV
jgi:hypothetical protein